MNSISPWTASAQVDINNSIALVTITKCGYTFEIHNCRDSFWITILGTNKERIAFRAAYAFNSFFEIDEVKNIENELYIILKSEFGKYEIEIDFPEKDSHLLHYKTSFKANFPIKIPFQPRDIVPLTENGKCRYW